jgi:hypothetical protein
MTFEGLEEQTVAGNGPADGARSTVDGAGTP